MFLFYNHMIKSLFAISAAVVCMTGDITVQKASAASSYCYETETGADVCVLAVRRHKTDYTLRLVKYAVNGQVATSEVYCDPALANNYKENLWGIACYQFTF